MSAYLIVGLPGSGKSTVLHELQNRGYQTLDADDDIELSQWRHRKTGQLTRHREPESAQWNDNYDWAWNEGRLTDILAQRHDSLFIGGNASNVKDFYCLFSKVFALVLDDTTLTARINGRPNGYGKASDERGRILVWNTDFAATETARGATNIDAATTPAHIADAIIRRLS